MSKRTATATYIYVKSPTLRGCHPHLRQLTYKKMLFEITRMSSKSLA